MIELSSIGRGLRVVDDVVKRAPVKILSAEPLSAGKYMVLFGGEVAPVEESMEAGLVAGGEHVIHSLLIPNLHAGILPALEGPLAVADVGALAIVETLSIASAVIGADQAAKTAEITILHLRLANGIGGKGFFTLCGPLPDVEAAVAAAEDSIGTPWLAAVEIVASPHPDAIAQFVGGRH